MVIPFQQSPENVRAQVITNLRNRELQEIRETCNLAIRQLVNQNLKDLAARK